MKKFSNKCSAGSIDTFATNNTAFTTVPHRIMAGNNGNGNGDGSSNSTKEAQSKKTIPPLG